MSSWVAPSVAAEMWGISVQQVMDWIANGTVASYADGQFLFVDIASRGYEGATPPAPPAPSAEQTVVTPQELTALTEDTNDHHLDEDSIPEEEADAPQRDVAQWRTARQNASRQRRPPVTTKS
jgi:hypothetical protein